MPESSTCLELTIAIAGLSSSSSVLKTVKEGEGGGSGGGGVMTIRDLDINQIPSGGGGGGREEEYCMEDEDDSPSGGGRGGGPPRKKLRLTKEQSRLLEESFRQNHTLNPKQKEVLAMELKLKPRQVEVWFQNRRARSKLKQTEMECEYMKKWCSSLAEQNRRLKKEVEELRALKVGPPNTAQNCNPLPASTLTMCPRCERVNTVVGQDKGGPTPTPTSNATTTTSSAGPTLSGKGPSLFQPRQHPSAAC